MSDIILNAIHAQYPVFPKSLWDKEIVEQTMSVMYLEGHENVLEIGGCIGRNSIVIGSRLARGGGNLVTLEANPKLAAQLKTNIAKTGLNIQVVGRALSAQRIVVRDWVSRPLPRDAPVPPGWTEVPTITYAQLLSVTGVRTFDTLVLDCEGAFYQIVRDYPQILRHVSKVLIENDFLDPARAAYVHKLFRVHGMKPLWSHPLDPGNRGAPRYSLRDVFWQYWAKDSSVLADTI